MQVLYLLEKEKEEALNIHQNFKCKKVLLNGKISVSDPDPFQETLIWIRVPKKS